MSDDPNRPTDPDPLWAMTAPSANTPYMPPSNQATSADTIDLVSAERPAAPRKRRKTSSWIEWIVVIVVAVSAALLVRQFVLQQFAVSGSSMYSTLHDGDRVLVNKLSYRLHDPRRGDVVVLKTMETIGERDLIKRVVALPGETVEYRACALYIDGRQLQEPYLDPKVVTTTDCGNDQQPLVVPAKHVFVLGDNRGGSKDSRDPSLGPIAYSDIIGRAFVVIWPFGDWRWL